MKYRDWFIAGILVALGVYLLITASMGMRPMWVNMGAMMGLAMFLPWIMLVAIVVMLVCLGGSKFLFFLHMTANHTCPHCKKHVRTVWKVCPYCGLPIEK